MFYMLSADAIEYSHKSNKGVLVSVTVGNRCTTTCYLKYVIKYFIGWRLLFMPIQLNQQNEITKHSTPILVEYFYPL